MTDADPFATQRDASGSVAAELAAAGFSDAVEIGRGGFGAVYRCRQASLDRVVAVKVLTADLDEDNRARFFREQRAAGRLTGHPNIVNVLHADVTDAGRPYIVMPYYPHGSLDARIRGDGPLGPEEVLRLGVKMAGALETAHRFGVLHRDVKPGNVLYTDYDEPTLADFGIAHIGGGFVTGSGIVTGTPAFTAPEVIAGEAAGPAADVYGLGATLFAAITGHAAFERRDGEQLVAQFLRITSEPVPNLRAHGIPDDVSAVIEHAMAAAPGNRPSAADLGEQLRAAQTRHGFPVDVMALYTPLSGEPAAESDQKFPSAGSQQLRLAGASSGSGRLPLELTSFIDRRTELTRATNSLSTSRLVTLTGIGGVGKTRLAVQVATTTQRDFADGVVFVELGELRDESLLVSVVASALELQDRSVRPLREVLAEFLADRTLLLVLDNCEQLLDAVAELAESLLRACPGLRILATSREPIGLAGEAVLPIHPLEVPDPDRLPRNPTRNDAMKLFGDRAATAVPGFELTEGNQRTIARICRQLDGLPLPIELATAWLRVMSPEQILRRLTDRFALLTRGSRTAPPRQQTLRMCIDWSYDLCTPVQQGVWAQLSVFAGSFDLEAAQYVCGDDLAAEDLLNTVAFLVDKSILTREESGSVVRFRMLDTVRDYGHEKAQRTSGYLELCRRHRDWCQQLALDANADLFSPRDFEWVGRLRREERNMRQALEFCVSDSPEAGIRIASALLPFRFSHGSLAEERHWLERLLARRTGRATVDQAAAFYAACLIAAIQGDIAGVTDLVREGHALVEQTTDPLIRAHIDFTDGLLALFSGNPSEARPYVEKALQVYTERGGPLLFRVDALTFLGLTHGLCDDTARAIEYYERALAITEKYGGTIYPAYALWALGVAWWRRGEPVRATRLVTQALRVSWRVDDRTNISMCLQALAWIAADHGDAERVVVLTAAAEKIGRSVGTAPTQFSQLLAFQEECERRTRAAISEQAYAAAHREGAALDFDAAIAYALGEQSSPASRDTTGRKLTRREREVAELVAEGLTNREIAARLVISPRTAQGHVEHVLTKLGFTSRTQVAAWIAASRNSSEA
ncbi:protein kinase domain-containing protein [Nocardia araoensis]|uniref:protein kinase domain-containing protein n=1 Tax=Nocardia araoensis TaxID=228600 RepID=UPI00030D73D2|nr:protein kinase [Nocardia araoensis]